MDKMIEKLTMKRQYTKKLVEDFVKTYPKEFLEEELKIIKKPHVSGWIKPTLVFEDVNGIPVIVEIQLSALNIDHVQKALKYKELCFERENRESAKILFLCNSVSKKIDANLFDEYSIECKFINKKEFMKRADELSHEAKIIKYSSPSNQSRRKITVDDILKVLNAQKKKSDRKEVELDAMVYWQWDLYCWLNHRSEPTISYINWSNLNEIENQGETFFNDDKHTAVPMEILISNDFLSEIDNENAELLLHWFEILYRYGCHQHQIKDSELKIVFGWRQLSRFYRYDMFIENNIQRFEPLWDRYRIVDREQDYYDYDIEKMKEDISFLQKLVLYGGKYPDYSEVRLCSDFEIINGPGPLLKDWHYYNHVQDNIDEGGNLKLRESLFGPIYEPKSIWKEEFDEKNWYTVVFKGISSDFIKIAQNFLKHVLIKHWSSNSMEYQHVFQFDKGVLRFNQKCDTCCIIPPKQFKDINHEALKLSSQYFMHFKNPDETKK